MVARFDPAAKTVTVLSIPRDLWVNIPGDVTDISGMNRINAAYNSGPDLLIQTIEQDLGIPINHYIAVDFPGFSGMVNALGGITMDFPTAVKDAVHRARRHDHGLPGGQRDDRPRSWCAAGTSTTWTRTATGSTTVSRTSAGSSARTPSSGPCWPRLNQIGLNPITINSFIGAAVGNLTIDDTLTESDLLHIAEDFQGLPSSHLVTETLPTIGLRHRRRRRRAEGGAALRPEHDQRVQPDRDRSAAGAKAGNGAQGHETTTTTMPTVPARPGQPSTSSTRRR